MKVYICPITEIVNINISDSLLDNIGIHRTMGLDEDAANEGYFDEGDEFFDEYMKDED